MRRFSIRDLLWLTLVVGLALGWWVDHQRQLARRLPFPPNTKYVQFKALSQALEIELREKFPATSITITVNGIDVTTTRTYPTSNLSPNGS